MHVGEKYKLFIPAELAYGAQSPSPLIPANSVLVFDLELIAIKTRPNCKALSRKPRLQLKHLPSNTGWCSPNAPF